MKISYNWLRTYIDTHATPQELAVMLTGCGLEVESLEPFETVRGGLQGVVVGHVVECRKHPQADRLTLTRVDIGQGEPLPIVCGAPNVAEGQKVLVATVGTTLYTPSGSLEIKKARIRGEESMGMICAEDELGLGNSHQGIMVLADDAIVGTAAARYFDLQQDWVFEIGLTPNRIDAASHLGVARDLVAVINHLQKGHRIQLKRPSTEDFSIDNHELLIPVVIEDPEACPRYTGITISGVSVKESPKWLQDRLRAIGLKPINNVVDITNFVLHELGQPLHAFNADAIKGRKVVVRKPPEGTLFVTLDKEEKKLTGSDLMICDAQQPMCMAGILGGLDSGVDEHTRNIFLESACFSPLSIRRSARHHGISTDASFRFERGADPGMAPLALMRAAALIRQIAGGKISSPIMDEYPGKRQPATVEFSFARLNALVGNTIPVEQVRGILQDLDIEVLHPTQEGLLLQIPLYRVDVTREADVIEEVLRIYGYNQVSLPGRLFSSLVLSPKPDKEALQNLVAGMLSARGFNEIMNNSLTRASWYESFGFDASATVSILNPLSQDLNALRQSLLFGGLETIAYNRNRKVTDMKLYEFGNVYRRDDSGNTPLRGYREGMRLDLFLTGNYQPESWNTQQQPVDFSALKEAVVQVMQRLGIDEQQLDLSEGSSAGIFQYQLQYLQQGGVMASLGLLAPGLLKAFDIRQEVYYASLDWDAIMALSGQQQLLYRPIPRFPEVRRDLALLVGSQVSFEQIRQLAFRTGRKLLRAVRLFDVYHDQKLGAGKKSYAVAFTLLDENKTLTEGEIDRFMQKMSDALEKELGAEIRR